jgi:hypothetical protein
MQVLTQRELLGFVEVQVGSKSVQVPICAAKKDDEARIEALATFVSEGDAYAIVVRGDSGSPVVERAVREAAHEAERHLSRKLLN